VSSETKNKKERICKHKDAKSTKREEKCKPRILSSSSCYQQYGNSNVSPLGGVTAVIRTLILSDLHGEML